MPARLPTRQQTLAETPPAPAFERPAVRAYRLQLQRVDKLRAQLAELDALAQWQRVERLRHGVPLKRRAQAIGAELVRTLDQALLRNELGPRHRNAAAQCLCEHAETLADDGDAALAAEMAKLHDRHSRETLAAKKRAMAEALRAELETHFGGPLMGVDGAANRDEVLHVARQQWQRDREVTREKRAARVQARQARQGAVESGALATDPAVEWRRLYRQLASALHPDREPDADLRAHKTQLMSEANTAYASGDLVTLMRLQRDLDLIPAEGLRDAGDERLASLTMLLKRQVADLERERAERQSALAHEAGLPARVVARPDTLQRHVQAGVEQLQKRVAELEASLEQCARPDGLKPWLNRRLAAQG
jgi:hypothetical protein